MIRPVLAALIMVAAVASPVAAAQFRAFDRAAFETARAAGGPVLVDVHAGWCPVCAAQERVIKATTASANYDELTVFRIDYDTQKPEWKRLGATKQSTLIGFKGGREVGRLAYETDRTKINALLGAIVR